MRKPLAAGVAVLAVALSLGLAACGSDDSDESLSHEDLIVKADEICVKYEERLDELTESSLDDSSGKPEVVAFISDEIVPLYEEQIDELKALEPNADDAEAWDDMLSTLESEVQTVKDDPEGALESSDPFSGGAEKAKEFGLKECGSGS